MDIIITQYREDMRSIKKSYDEYNLITDAIGTILSHENLNISESCINELRALKDECNKTKENLFQNYVDLCVQESKYQDTCDHDWKYLWHDSHYDYYECVKCGLKERR